MNTAIPSKGSGGLRALLNQRKSRAVIIQGLFLGALLYTVWFIVSTTAHNLTERNMASGFGFLLQKAGFDISWSILPYDKGTYLQVFFVGIGNTLILSAAGIVATTILGFVVGLARLSRNYIARTLAGIFVEMVRNTPLLLQILFWYIVVFSQLPGPRQSFGVFGLMEFNNRGFYFPAADLTGLVGWLVLAAVLLLIAVLFLWRHDRKRRAQLGRDAVPFRPWRDRALLVLPVVMLAAAAWQAPWDLPRLDGFNFSGGWSVPPSFCAALVALTVNHAAFMAENVRAGVQSVPSGQHEAGFAIGLHPSQRMRRIVIPQALRTIVPPTILTWITLIKNSSLAVAIGYPELISVFMQTSLNQSGRAIEIVVMVMAFYSVVCLAISGGLNLYNRRVQIAER